VEVGHGFAAVGALVDDETKAVFEAEFFSEDSGREEQVAEQGFICGRGRADAGNGLLRDDQQVDGRLGSDVVEDDAAVVLVLDLGGDFAVDDFLEERLGHRVRMDAAAGRRQRCKYTLAETDADRGEKPAPSLGPG